jgi:UDP-N-acetylmuramoyl-L-alanyl-D-glutamate--2,6-diaminopimelate ligase
MKLDHLLTFVEGVEYHGSWGKSDRVREVNSLAHRPEKWTEGVLFVDFRKGPIPVGAVVLVSEPRLDFSGPQIVCGDLVSTSRRLSLIVHQGALKGLDLIAVTGTNGKSTVVHLARQLLDCLSHPVLSLGTLGLRGMGLDQPTPNTTNFPLDLHPLLSDVKEAGGKTVFMEASSIALREKRLEGLEFFATGWTNLSQDHLDVHGSMEEYWEDKRQLLKLGGGKVVYNLDDPFTASLQREGLSMSYSISDSGADYYFKEAKASADGFELELVADGEGYPARVSFLGRHNLSNLLCAVGLVESLGVAVSEMVSVFPELDLPRGRFARAETRALGRTYIDYAHSPDGLEKTLMAAREHFPKERLKVLFGCGGDRDSNKRAPMGKLASELADEVWLTSDNSRGEETGDILKDIALGMSKSPERQLEDRERAIHDALSSMKEGDVLLICGKGHETEQVLGDSTLTLDEFSCCKNF